MTIDFCYVFLLVDKESLMNKSILVAALIAVALTACGKKEEPKAAAPAPAAPAAAAPQAGMAGMSGMQGMEAKK